MSLKDMFETFQKIKRENGLAENESIVIYNLDTNLCWKIILETPSGNYDTDRGGIISNQPETFFIDTEIDGIKLDYNDKIYFVIDTWNGWMSVKIE